MKMTLAHRIANQLYLVEGNRQQTCGLTTFLLVHSLQHSLSVSTCVLIFRIFIHLFLFIGYAGSNLQHMGPLAMPCELLVEWHAS